MAHFAKLDDNNVVLAVHVVNNEVITIDGIEVEQVGIDFLTSLHGHTNWKQTSYNASFRNKYASIGDSYNSELDVFIPRKIWNSWVLDIDTYTWKAPVPYPVDEKNYNWDEENQQWIEIQE
jgi:hypothetical protein